MSVNRKPRSPHRLVVRMALAAVVAVLTLIATPGPASAATSTVTPIFKCYIDTGSSYKVVFSYKNTSSSSVTYKSGATTTDAANTFYPTTYNGAQTTTFKSGTWDGAFYVTVSYADSQNFTYTLGSTKLTFASVASTATTCPSGTTMPAEGNGTGLAIGLIGAGIVGFLVVRRTVRRATRTAVG